MLDNVVIITHRKLSDTEWHYCRPDTSVTLLLIVAADHRLLNSLKMPLIVLEEQASKEKLQEHRSNQENWFQVVLDEVGWQN